jgi:monoamine oxidase
MVAALELGKAGYECRVLEAGSRPGGRNWTLRGGDTVEEVDSTQRIAFLRAKSIEDDVVLDGQSEGFGSSVLVPQPAMSHKRDSAKSLVR